MKYILSVINPEGSPIMDEICSELNLPMSFEFQGRGTATKSMLDLLGIESKDKRIIITIADEEKTKKYIREQRLRLYIDAPGNGITVAVPVKSIGGGKTLALLNGETPEKIQPDFNFTHELIIAIATEGHSDPVVDAAKAAGAGGGTIIHGKGIGPRDAEKFFKVTIASEKEIILIVAKTEKKAAIMESIMKNAGPSTESGTVVFSLPVSDIAGFSLKHERKTN